MFSLESSHRGDSNEFTQYTIFNINKKIHLNYPKSAAMGFFERTQDQVRNNRGKQAISVRATKGILYLVCIKKSSPNEAFERNKEAGSHLLGNQLLMSPIKIQHHCSVSML